MEQTPCFVICEFCISKTIYVICICTPDNSTLLHSQFCVTQSDTPDIDKPASKHHHQHHNHLNSASDIDNNHADLDHSHSQQHHHQLHHIIVDRDDYISSPASGSGGYDTSASTATISPTPSSSTPSSSHRPTIAPRPIAAKPFALINAPPQTVLLPPNKSTSSSAISTASSATSSLSKDSTPERSLELPAVVAGAQKHSPAAESPPGKQLPSVVAAVAAAPTMALAPKRPPATKIEDRLLSFEIMSASQLQADAAEKTAVQRSDLPVKVDVLKRRELFERSETNESGWVQQQELQQQRRRSSDLSKTVAAVGAGSKVIKERLLQLEQQQQQKRHDDQSTSVAKTTTQNAKPAVFVSPIATAAEPILPIATQMVKEVIVKAAASIGSEDSEYNKMVVVENNGHDADDEDSVITMDDAAGPPPVISLLKQSQPDVVPTTKPPAPAGCTEPKVIESAAAAAHPVADDDDEQHDHEQETSVSCPVTTTTPPPPPPLPQSAVVTSKPVVVDILSTTITTTTSTTIVSITKNTKTNTIEADNIKTPHSSPSFTPLTKPSSTPLLSTNNTTTKPSALPAKPSTPQSSQTCAVVRIAGDILKPVPLTATKLPPLQPLSVQCDAKHQASTLAQPKPLPFQSQAHVQQPSAGNKNADMLRGISAKLISAAASCSFESGSTPYSNRLRQMTAKLRSATASVVETIEAKNERLKCQIVGVLEKNRNPMPAASPEALQPPPSAVAVAAEPTVTAAAAAPLSPTLSASSSSTTGSSTSGTTGSRKIFDFIKTNLLNETNQNLLEKSTFYVALSEHEAQLEAEAKLHGGGAGRMAKSDSSESHSSDVDRMLDEELNKLN